MDDIQAQPDQQPVVQTAPTEAPPQQQAPSPEPEKINAPLGAQSNQAPTQPDPNSIALPTDEPEGGEAFKAGQNAAAGVKPNFWQHASAILGIASGSSAIGIPGYISDDPGYALRYLKSQQQAQQDQIDNAPQLQPDELNRLFPLPPGISVPFNSAMTKGQAQLIYDHFQHIQDLTAWKDKGDALPWGVETGIGIAGGALDPVNVALMSLTGGFAKLAGLAPSVARVFGENLAINAATAIPGYFEAKREQENVTPLGTAGEIIGGAIAGTALHAVAGQLFKALGAGVDAIRGTPADVVEDNFKTALAQSESGKAIDLEASQRVAESRVRGDTSNVEVSPYEFNPVQHPSEKPFYAARTAQDTSVEFKNLGPGTSMVDDGVAANNMVSHPGGDPGKLGRYDIPPETKLLNLDQGADTPEIKEFHDAVEAATGEKLDIQSGESIMDVLGRIGDKVDSGELPPDTMSKIQEITKQEGFEGYHGTLDSNGDQKNITHLFDDTKEPSDFYTANQDITPTRTPDSISKENSNLMDPSESKYITPELEKAIQDFNHEKGLNTTPQYMDPILEDQYQSARSMLDTWAKDDPELGAEIKDTLDADQKTSKQEQSIMKKLAECCEGVS